MPHPIQMIYAPHIRDVIEAYAGAIAAMLVDSGKTDEQIALHQQEFLDCWRGNRDNILTAISSEINYYLNYYRIQAKGSIDEFKTVYFTGVVVSRFLDRDGLTELRKYNDYAMIYLLDWRAHRTIGKQRKVLTNAMRKIASENAIEEKLGKHGLYLIYKCMCNAVDEVRKANAA